MVVSIYRAPEEVGPIWMLPSDTPTVKLIKEFTQLKNFLFVLTKIVFD